MLNAARRTRCNVAGYTFSGRMSARETVAVETPACCATSRIVAGQAGSTHHS